MKFQLISVDVFQTIVDVPSIEEKVLNIFLKDRYSAVIAEKVWNFIRKRVLNYFSKVVVETREFETVKFVFSRYFLEAFQKFDIECDHNEAAKFFAHQHNFAVPYNDTGLLSS
jgi:putative hydrolase of the HAD superfamily